MTDVRRMTDPGSGVPIRFAIFVGVGLAVMQLLWHYVANVAELSGETRGTAKEIVFWVGVVFLLVAAIRLAVTATTKWVSRTVLGVSLVMLTSAIVSSVALLLIRGHLSANSALLGASSRVTAVGGLVAIILYVLLPLGPAVAAGYLGRRIFAKLRNDMP
jgi:hypothetical protein